MRLTRQLGLGLLLWGAWHLTGCAHARPVRAEPQDLALTLRVSPQVGLAPLYVLASIRVDDPRGVLVCPQFALVWSIGGQPDGASSFPGDSCWEGGPRVQAPRPRVLALRYPGQWLIVAGMSDHGVSLWGSATVEVRR